MNELIRFTSKECLYLTELPAEVFVEEATLVAGVLNGLWHDEVQRVINRPNSTDTERLELCEAANRIVPIIHYAGKVTELVRVAVPDDAELTRIISQIGLADDPRLTIDTSARWFIQPKTDWSSPRC